MSGSPPPSPTTVTQLWPFCQPHKLQARIGDLIEIDRTLYSDWAVFVGNGEVIYVAQVVAPSGRRAIGKTGYLAGSPRTGDDAAARVSRSSLAQVAGKSLVRVNNKEVHAKSHFLTPLEPEVIVANASKRLGQKVPYNLLTQNGEHYVTEWRYGVKWSDQASTALEAMTMFNNTGVGYQNSTAAHRAMMTGLAAIFQHTLPVQKTQKGRTGHGHV